MRLEWDKMSFIKLRTYHSYPRCSVVVVVRVCTWFPILNNLLITTKIMVIKIAPQTSSM